MYVGGHPAMVTDDPTGMDWNQDKDGNYKHDKDVNKDTKLGEGEKYLGKTHKINVNKGKKKEYHYTLNEDGSFTDSRGKEYEAGSGEFDPGFKSGHKIDNTNSVFTADDLYEYAMNALPVAISTDITVGDGLVVGIQMNWVVDQHGGILIGIGPHIGGGLGSPVNITYQKKYTIIHE
jgi:hypothetical protein